MLKELANAVFWGQGHKSNQINTAFVTQKHLGDQGVCHTDIEKFYRKTRFKLGLDTPGKLSLS